LSPSKHELRGACRRRTILLLITSTPSIVYRLADFQTCLLFLFGARRRLFSRRTRPALSAICVRQRRMHVRNANYGTITPRRRVQVIRVGVLCIAAAAALSAAPAKDVTFYKDIEPILQARCQRCHRPGEAAPMSLLTYQEARPWAKAI